MSATLDSAYGGAAQSGGTITPALEAAVYKKVTARIIPFMFLLYIIAYLDRVNVSFAKLQMMGDLKFSDGVYATGAGIFFIGYFIFEVPSNIILERVGAKLWIARIMILWGIISSCFMFVESQWGFYGMRFLLGVGEAGFFPGMILYLTYWYPAKRRALMVGMFMSAIAVSGVVGGPISGGIMQGLDGVAGMRGWQWLFLLEGIPAVIFGIVVLFYLDNGPKSAKWLTDQEKAVLQHYLDEDLKHKENTEHVHGIGQAFAYPKVWFLAFVYFSVVVGNYAFTFWLPQIIKDLGVNNKFYIGLLTAIPWACAAVAMNYWGHHSDRTGERRWHVAGAFLLAAVGFVLTAIFNGQAVISIITLSIIAAAVLSGVITFWSLPTAFLSGAGAAAGIAIINSVGNLGGYFGPNIINWIKQLTGGPTGALYTLAGILVLGAIVTLSLARPKAEI